MPATRSQKPTTKALARPGDPLVTHDGRVIKPDRLEAAPRDTATELRAKPPDQFRPTRRISAKELPAPVNVMNGIGVIFMYTMLGLSDREISDALKLDMSQILELRKHTAYTQLFESILYEFVNAESDLIQSRIAAYSHNALSQVADLSDNSEEDAIRLRASMDILDRAGHSPKAGEARKGINMSDLRIIVMDGNAKVEVNINTD